MVVADPKLADARAGAYDYGVYRRGMDGRTDPRLGAAIVAIKDELVYNGTGRDVKRDVLVIGDATHKAMRDFQAAQGLTADGTFGKPDLRELFRKRIENVEDRHGLPRGVLGRKSSWESGFDPVALGPDKKDRGIAQINRDAHPDVSDEEAFTPSFALPWAGRYLASLKAGIEEEAGTMKAARAAYNTGRTVALQWMRDGFPSAGGPVNERGEDLYTVATMYVNRIDQEPF